jgi:hypothetical protein
MVCACVCAIATRPCPSVVRESKKKHGWESDPNYAACASKQGNSDGLACYVAVPLAGKHVTLVGWPDPFSPVPLLPFVFVSKY